MIILAFAAFLSLLITANLYQCAKDGWGKYFQFVIFLSPTFEVVLFWTRSIRRKDFHSVELSKYCQPGIETSLVDPSL